MDIFLRWVPSEADANLNFDIRAIFDLRYTLGTRKTFSRFGTYEATPACQTMASTPLSQQERSSTQRRYSNPETANPRIYHIQHLRANIPIHRNYYRITKPTTHDRLPRRHFRNHN
jgi:hypothetical protein